MCSSISMDRWIDIDVMSGSKAGFYAWRGRPDSPRKAANRALPAEIRRLHAAHRGHHGAPRIDAALRAGGIRQAAAASSASCVIMASGHKPRGGSGCVARTAITICPFQHIGYIRCVHFAPNRLDRNFAVERPNQVWLASIEGYDNRQRLPSALGYITPEQAERKAA
jgi:putative transposase